MKFIADLHIHSKYARATSPNSDIEHISEWAKIKGIDLVATGDWTHPVWIKELKKKLKPASSGLFQFNGVRFILGTEISCIYKKADKVRKIHILVYVPSFVCAEKINKYLSRHGFNLHSDGRPILGIDSEELAKIILNICDSALIIPAHIWTPWFSLYGSRSGFDSIQECFGEMSKHIFAIETGLSADPEACWRISDLDNIAIISNSDAHSPSKLGREVTVFNSVMSYSGFCAAIKQNKIIKTIEFYPQEGKYHFDGHRDCNVCLSPEQANKLGNICPVCHKPLTLGVMHRVFALSDKTKEQIKKTALLRPQFQKLVPLQEVIGQALGFGPNTKTVNSQYQKMIMEFKNEFNILLNVKLSDMQGIIRESIIMAIERVRNGNLHISPGYDGKYGTVSIFNEQERKQMQSQKHLF